MANLAYHAYAEINSQIYPQKFSTIGKQTFKTLFQKISCILTLKFRAAKYLQIARGIHKPIITASGASGTTQTSRASLF